MRKDRRALTALAVVLGSSTGSVALAQTAAPASAERPAVSISEVVVTAQKRSERLQDVPISVAALTADQLAVAHLTDTADLQYVVPSIALNQNNSPRAFGVYVRGLGTSTFATQSIEPSSAYVVDGVVYGQAGAAFQDMPDLQRVEVLRGPQGTLFGKNASVGVVSITTRDPGRVFEAEANAHYAAPYDDRGVSLLLTGPITDNLRFIVSGRLSQRDGFVRNLFNGRRLNNRNEFGVRSKLAADLDDWTFTLAGDYFNRHSHCCMFTMRATGATPTAFEQVALGAGIVPSPTNLNVDIDGHVISFEKNYGASFQAERHFQSGYSLVSLTAYRRWWTKDTVDGDGLPTNLLNISLANYWQYQTSEELRLTSPTGGPFDYVAGLYFFDQGVTSSGLQLNNVSPSAAFLNLVHATTRNLAVFGQGNLHLSDRFTLIAGFRALQDKYTAERARSNPIVTTIATVRNAADKATNGTVYRLGAQYTFDRNHMVFATFTRGFKGGGFDTNPTINGLPSVRPEVPTNFEVGFRTQWLENRLTLNATAFDTNVRDFQAPSTQINPGTVNGVTTIVNVANLRSRGVEFDGLWRPLQDVDFTLGLNGAYIDAFYGSYDRAPCYFGQTAALGCQAGVIPGTSVPTTFQVLTGKPLGQQPKWTLNLTEHFSHALANGMRVNVDGAIDHQTKRLAANFNTDPHYLEPARTLINLSIALTPADDRWRIALYARNLGDVHYVNTIQPNPFGIPNQSFTQYPLYEARRIVGVQLFYKWGG
ncbi:MAG: TonB-dependent receptor [Caulobacterales bacterium]|nr:TonB-dependent receptor [Caulobacterales bacterium]